jgi:hypothetical protein
MPSMRRKHPYKQTSLGLLLSFAYPEDGETYFDAGLIPAPGLADEESINAYPDKDALRAAVIAVLRAHITREPLNRSVLKAIERAQNEPVTVTFALRMTTPLRLGLMRADPIGRIVTDRLFSYLNESGPLYGSICQKCAKVFLLTKERQRFCSKQCRQDFWNDQKMEGYYAEKLKQSREHKKRLKKRGRP